jgi:hypothetical protein
MAYQLNSSANGFLLHIRARDLPSSSFNSPYTTDFTVNLASPIVCQNNEHIIMALHSVSFPTSFYNIDVFNNKFIFYSISDPLTPQTITIPPLNYTARTLATQIGTLLTTAEASTGGSSVYTASYSAGINGFVIVNSTNQTFQVDFNTPNSAYISIGFNETLYTGTSGILQSVNSISLNRTFSIYLHTDLVLSSCMDSHGRLTDIFERVPVITQNNIVYYRPTSSLQKFVIDKKSIQSLRIRMTYDGNDPVNLNGLYPEISLQFYITGGLGRNPEDNTRPEYQPVVSDETPV